MKKFFLFPFLLMNNAILISTPSENQDWLLKYRPQNLSDFLKDQAEINLFLSNKLKKIEHCRKKAEQRNDTKSIKEADKCYQEFRGAFHTFSNEPQLTNIALKSINRKEKKNHCYAEYALVDIYALFISNERSVSDDSYDNYMKDRSSN